MIDSRFVLCLAAGLITAVVYFQFRGALRRLLWKSPPIVSGSGQGTPISVIIPARNEGMDLGRSLDSLRAQTGVEFDAIIVNDHSTDTTGAIADLAAAADPRVRVIHDPKLRPGWLGKCNAMEHAAGLARSDLLLFTDADIIFEPTCFAAALAELKRNQLDLLSFFPRMDCISLWENIIVPVLVSGLAALATPGLDDPASPDALAAGALILIRAEVLRAIGGFAAIRGEFADDLALAKTVKAAGFRVAVRAAPELLHVRLYKGNRHAFWAMTKNVLVGLRGRIWLAPIAGILPFFGYGMPLYCACAGMAEGNAALALAGAAVCASQYAMLLPGRSLFRFNRIKALLFPLVAFPVFCCMIRAWYLYTCRGAVEWRGRTIQVRKT